MEDSATVTEASRSLTQKAVFVTAHYPLATAGQAHLRLHLTCDCKTSLATAGTAESLVPAGTATASTFWGVRGWGPTQLQAIWSLHHSSRLRYHGIMDASWTPG